MNVPTRTETKEGGKVGIPLREVASTANTTGPSTVRRKELRREVRISANTDGRAFGDSMKDVDNVTAGMEMPAGYDVVGHV